MCIFYESTTEGSFVSLFEVLCFVMLFVVICHGVTV